MTKPPYERIVQWTAGPISIVAGWLATQLTLHAGILGSLGLSGNASAIVRAGSHLAVVPGSTGTATIAHAIVVALTFITGTAVTYAAHHKWLSNLSKWWESSGLLAPAISEPAPGNFAPDSPDYAPGSPDFADAITAHHATQASQASAPEQPPTESPTPPAPSQNPADALRAQLSAAGITPSA